MKDFDAERIVRPDEERSFKVNGTVFNVRPTMAALTIADFEDAYFSEVITGRESVELLQSFIQAALVTGQEKEWKKACDPKNEMPLSIGQLEMISNHIRVAVSGRPFMRQPDSGGSPETTGTTSTAGLPSQAAA